jgi:hypothetical protein
VCSFKISLKFNVQEIDVKGNSHGNPYPDDFSIAKKVNKYIKLLNF